MHCDGIILRRRRRPSAAPSCSPGTSGPSRLPMSCCRCRSSCRFISCGAVGQALGSVDEVRRCGCMNPWWVWLWAGLARSAKRERETDRQTDRDKDRQRERERERQSQHCSATTMEGI